MKKISFLLAAIIVFTFGKIGLSVPIDFDIDITTGVYMMGSGESDDDSGNNYAYACCDDFFIVPDPPHEELWSFAESEIEAVSLNNGGRLNWRVEYDDNGLGSGPVVADAWFSGTFTIGTDPNTPVGTSIELVLDIEQSPIGGVELPSNYEFNHFSFEEIEINNKFYNDGDMLSVTAGSTYNIGCFLGENEYGGVAEINFFVPEPASLLLLGFGSLILRKRK